MISRPNAAATEWILSLFLCAGIFLGVSALHGQLDVAGSQFWTQESPGFLETAQDGAQPGSSFAVGNFDADGYDDLAVGVPRADDQTFGECTLCNIGKVATYWNTGSLLTFDTSFW